MLSGSDDESTLRRNTNSFNECDLVPNILASVGKPDLSTTLFGRKIDMPIFLSPAAMQRLYHPEGDKASARAAEKYGTFYSMSSMGNNSIEEISKILNSKNKHIKIYTSSPAVCLKFKDNSNVFYLEEKWSIENTRVFQKDIKLTCALFCLYFLLDPICVQCPINPALGLPRQAKDSSSLQTRVKLQLFRD